MWRLGSIICLALALSGLTLPTASNAQVICISNASPPPELPVYEQPPIPAPGYIWTPGYWAGGPSGYFWVPGTWVEPPTVGLLWTPGYWGWRDGIYVWNAGYWGPHVGFYGGINYGFGYGGVGYEGGRWENGVFAYNRTVNNFGGIRITNVYEKTVIVEPGISRVSFNGGSGGTIIRPTPEQEAAAHEQHVAAIPAQLQHERTASANKALQASENHGQPAIAATAKPGEFTGKGVVAARKQPPSPAPAPRRSAPQRLARQPGPRLSNESRVQLSLHLACTASPPPHPEQSAIKPAPPPPHPEQSAIKPAPPPPPPHPEQSAIKPAPPPPPPHPEQSAIRPAPPPPPPHPEQSAIRPAPPPPPQPAAPAAAKPAAPPTRPACPPGKTPAEVNGHPACR